MYVRPSLGHIVERCTRCYAGIGESNPACFTSAFLATCTKNNVSVLACLSVRSHRAIAYSYLTSLCATTYVNAGECLACVQLSRLGSAVIYLEPWSLHPLCSVPGQDVWQLWDSNPLCAFSWIRLGVILCATWHCHASIMTSTLFI